MWHALIEMHQPFEAKNDLQRAMQSALARPQEMLVGISRPKFYVNRRNKCRTLEHNALHSTDFHQAQKYSTTLRCDLLHQISHKRVNQYGK